MSDEEDSNNRIINEQMTLEGGDVSIGSINKNHEVKWPARRKIDKKLKNRRRNARIHRLLLPKSALVVFSELFRGVPIQIEKSQLWHEIAYTATIEIDGQLFTGNHISKTEAKQKACEQLFRCMLSKKLILENEKDMEHDSAPKSREAPQEDFPWPHFASFAMHKLINQWQLQPDSEGISLQDKRSFGILLPPKAAAPMKKFPLDPTSYHPVSLLVQLRPDVTFTYTILHPVIHANCVIDGIRFTGQGSSKKCAKKECCINAISHIWNIDYRAIDLGIN